MTTSQLKNYYQKGLKQIVVALKKCQPEKIILFGSAVAGEFHQDSDIVDTIILRKP